ncbi:hypothetical protein M431DRAFT_80087 [Trichoderma harzianum CBS 226.95]|uniref:Uncharacterized protein n=1 Tax=Trichoderma harzianum CBS 226.95 TaxID=983964 RepID=A0A2T4AHU6_TRIHA|nr:hypothetical protein M431DRAFT_80087 [Trichoderma harzianum CBS 226.95]PTB56623.1 hypothetical protein M431DRAFT_80087 [Trichoderma harzianum CBS 226.95]
MQVFERKGHGYFRRRSDSCLGWHCLSSATHFGIIFSVVVVVIVLSIVWMYYMGRARIMGNQTKLHNVPRRQRNRQLHRSPNGPTRPVSHLVQPAPVLQYGVAQQTPIYFFSSRPQILTIQPPGVINPHLYLPAPIVRPPEAPRPKPSDDVASSPPKAEETQQEKVQPSGNESPMRHPTWWQRLYRAFTLPVGVASTVASSPSPEPLEPLPPTHINIRHSASCPNFDNHAVQTMDRKEARESERSPEEQDDTSSMVCNLDTSNDSMLSIRSDIATVHSDDYEMPLSENNQPRSHKEMRVEPSS